MPPSKNFPKSYRQSLYSGVRDGRVIAASVWITGSLLVFFGLVINTPLVQGYLLVEQ